MKEYHKEYSALAMSFLTQFLDDAKVTTKKRRNK
jgi:hypothetical protein